MTRYFFAVDAGDYAWRIDFSEFTDERNEKISSEVTDDLYEVDELDFIGLFENNDIVFRSPLMEEKYSKFKEAQFHSDQLLLFFSSTYKDVCRIRNYVEEMDFCAVSDFVGVRGFETNVIDDEPCEYVLLELDTESG